MSDELKVIVSLTPEEVKAADGLLAEMIGVDLFKHISYDSFLILEKFTEAVRLEQNRIKQNQLIAERLKNMQEWAENRCTACKHQANDHALGGTGLCIRESCPCMKYEGK